MIPPLNNRVTWGLSLSLWTQFPHLQQRAVFDKRCKQGCLGAQRPSPTIRSTPCSGCPGRPSHRWQLLGSWGLSGLAAAAPPVSGHGPTPSAPWEGQGHSSSPPLSASPPAPTPTPPRGGVLAPPTPLRAPQARAPARATAGSPASLEEPPTRHLTCTCARARTHP